jgi:hypothetical protein
MASGKGGSQGVVLIEVFDLGEQLRVYDDFSDNFLNPSLWIVRNGNPVVRDGYFYCNPSEYSSDLGAYMCRVTSVEKSNSWGIAFVSSDDQGDANFEMEMCPGEVDKLRVCGIIEIEKTGLIYGKVVKKDEKGIVKDVLPVEPLPQLKNASFLWVVWNASNKTFTFLSKFNESSAVHAVSWLGGNLDKIYDRVPLEIYAIGSSPISSVFAVSYVER